MGVLLYLVPTALGLGLLGLFAFSNMNVAMDKIDGRRRQPGQAALVDDYGNGQLFRTAQNLGAGILQKPIPPEL